MHARHEVHVPLLFIVLALPFLPAPARAQSAPEVELSPVEVSLGLTINALAQDVNARPHCVDLSLPCTDSSPSNWGGFGLTLSLARNVTDRVGITADVSTFLNEWDSWDSVRAKRRAMNHVSSVLVGPKVSTSFFYAGNADREPGRFFAQVLVGAEASDVVPLRPALQIGGGVDFIVPKGESRSYPMHRPVHDVTFRMAVDYRVTPGTGRNLSGWRFGFGLVFGPRLSRS